MSTSTPNKRDDSNIDIDDVATNQLEKAEMVSNSKKSFDDKKDSVAPYVIKQRRAQGNLGMKACEEKSSPSDTIYLSGIQGKRQIHKEPFENSLRERKVQSESLSSAELSVNSRADCLRSSSYRTYTDKSNGRSWNTQWQKLKPSDQRNWREKPKHSLGDIETEEDLPHISDRDTMLRTAVPDIETGRVNNSSNSSQIHPESIRQLPIMKTKTDLGISQLIELKMKRVPRSKLSKPLTLRAFLDKDPKSVLNELTKSEIALKEFIEKTKENNHFLEQFLDILEKAFTCDTSPHAMILLFETLKENKFFDTLALFLFDMQDQIQDKANAVKHEHVLKTVLQIIVSQMSRNPSSVTVFSRVYKVIGQIINCLKDVDEYVLREDIDKQFVFLTERKKEVEQSLKSSLTTSVVQPPENFREIKITPGSNEIKGGVEPFLRANRKEGKYDDLDHYLDVQFRLLREDFVGPLREGISDYLKRKVTNQDTTGQKDQNTRGDLKIYNASVHSPVVTEHGYCINMKLEMTKSLRKINWSVSKRLIYGSLVCLTDDDFETFSLASVVGRDESDIKQGLFTIQLESSMKTIDMLHKVFKIAESPAYFESYKHVLTGLQKIKAGDIPFEKYIVHCESNVDKPAYLTAESTYDLRPLMEQGIKIVAERRLPDIDVTRTELQDYEEIYDMPVPSPVFSTSSDNAECVNIFDNDSWPDKEALHFDKSQYEAVKNALTKEFSLIQGPPGTGKTYIGLQITRALLHNRSQWQISELPDGQKNISPMLIVCYTNHALDQFLEGVHSFFEGDILRVGGRSNSEVLHRYNLRNFRQCFLHNSTPLAKIKSERLLTKSKLDDLSKVVSYYSKSLELYQCEIIHERVLFNVMERRFYNNLTFDQHSRKVYGQTASKIVEWLRIISIEVDVRRKLQNDTRAWRSKQVFVSVDDNLSERRQCGKKKCVHEGNAYTKGIRDLSIAYFVQDTVDPKKAGRKEDMRKLAAENDFKTLMKSKIHELITSPDIMSHEESNRISSVWHLSQNDRWRLYRMWLSDICRDIYSKIEMKRLLYESVSEQYRECLQKEDMEIMKNAAVIGMTTSGAAKYQSVLREIGPKIIIVEEAAEVLEAHIITTLSKSCQHLILIGDHKQLRPNPTVHRLAVRYNLNISLFERMIENEIKFNSLTLQHRMRPEIAGILRHIYPELVDNDNVKNYPNVEGVSTNLFFIQHNHLEENNSEMKSYSNLHEALFVVGLCRYLLLQEYRKEQITVLTTYTGQLMCIRNVMPFEEFEGVRVTVVDNYQGEENDIVILSLVRSNQENKIGFLKTNNRICVALSRAKIGMYLIGNFIQFSENSILWKTIIDDMKVQKKFGDSLKLYCQNHPTGDAIVAREGKDFRKAPNGGCSKRCDSRLQCGHVCQQFCHVSDTNHVLYRCRKPCQRVICDIHKCPDECYEECRPCQVLVAKIIPSCGHEQNVKCYLDPNEFVCQMPCTVALLCGHQCKAVCGAPHTSKCLESVQRELICGHTVSIECFQKTLEIECPTPCQALLKCEHLCEGTCGQCFRGRVHDACKYKCKQILVCGHECSAFCNNCPPCKEKCENRCIHSLCQSSCGELCVQCQEPCEWNCKHFQCSKLCWEPCDRPRCNEPCGKLLQCKHPCMGLCGEPCTENFCRECNVEDVTAIFFGDEDNPDARFVYLEDCGHNIESKAMDTYMDMKEETEAVQLKGCPRCKTLIRKCLRYGAVIKENLRQIEKVKQVVKDKSNVDSLEASLCKMLKSNQVYVAIEHRMSTLISTKGKMKWQCIKTILSRIEKYKRTICTENQIVTLQNQHVFFEAFVDVVWKMKDKLKKTDGTLKGNNIWSFFPKLPAHVLKERDALSEQEIADYKNELRRGNDYVRLLTFKEAIKVVEQSEDASKQISRIEKILEEPKRYEDENACQVKQELDNLKDFTGFAISEEERLEIVQAMGLSKGHWFKCQNNHIYAIGECGGAMEQGKCPECNANIGGERHCLTEGNKLAPEMDGASFAAYSEEANNMANFDMRDLQ